MVDWDKEIGDSAADFELARAQYLANSVSSFVKAVDGYISKAGIDRNLTDVSGMLTASDFYDKTEHEMHRLVIRAESLHKKITTVTKGIAEILRESKPQAIVSYVAAVYRLHDCMNRLSIVTDDKEHTRRLDLLVECLYVPEVSRSIS